MIRIWMLWVSLMLCSVQATGQMYAMKHYPARDHLPDETYLSLYEDAQSLLWIGTSHGVYSFDGISFDKHLPADPDRELHDVTSLYRDRGGVLWAGCQNGEIYFMEDNRLQLWEIEEGHPVQPIIAFAEEGNRLWIATYGEGVYYWENGRLYNVNADDGLSSNDIYAMILGPENRVWLATDAGINVVQVQDGNKHVRVLDRGAGLADEIVLSLFSDNGQTVFCGYFDEGLGSLDPAGSSVQNFGRVPGQSSVSRIGHADERYVWLSTEDGAIVQYEREKGRYQRVLLSEFEPSKLNGLRMGQEGNLWVLDEKQGLFSIQWQFSFHDVGLQNIQAIYMMKDGTRYVGNDEGAYRVDESDQGIRLTPLFSARRNVLSLHIDRDHELWVGTFGRGLDIRDLDGGHRISLTMADGIIENSILDITEYGESIFLSTLGGVSEIRNHDISRNGSSFEIRNYDSEDGLGTNYMYYSLADRNGKIWFATDGKGLCVKDRDGIECYSEYGDEVIHSVYSLVQDDKGRMWVSTDQNQVYYFEDSEFHSLDAWNIHHPAEEILSLVNDREGRIYIVGAYGLHAVRYDQEQLISYPGFGMDFPFEPILNAVHLDHEGMIWIGGKTGMIRFDPNFSQQVDTVRIILEQVNVFDQFLGEPEGAVLDYHDTYLSIRFKGLWYTNPSNIRYRYRMEGLDQNWQYTREPSASFYHLPAGQYNFVAEAALKDDFNDAVRTSFHFRMLAPFWKRPWFILSGIAIGIAFIFWQVKRREKKLQVESERRKKMLEAQYQTLKSQINPHFLFNSFNTLASTIEDNPEAAVEYVEYLADFYRSILQYREKDVIPLEEEIKLVNNYMYLIRKRFGENITMDVRLNGESRKIAPLSLQLLVENAVKHNVISKLKPLHISIETGDDDYIRVSNNVQKKSSVRDSTNYGLHSLVKRYELLSDKPVQVIETRELFTVKIPSIKNHPS